MDQNTVRKCAQMAANQQRSFLGAVDQDILDLLEEVGPEPVVVAEVAPAVEEVAPVAEETAPVVDETPAEEAAQPSEE